ncbi:putative inactive leucine-rich repeat receptor-like protein kinase [Apostasia shenzhenica]|uniref:Putative inactive leucine-rich repeat receptor-like protein kinase n=1 Tax=Apostasia shenzhenica TaxID=1088818 RepID=A0A2I0ADF5_9ASPA|nr:putative inactive leucine-rich repeat receptor-like protein kinase [Apostasia shenzhenica]
MAAVPLLLIHLILFLLPFPSLSQLHPPPMSDADALLLLKRSFNNPDPALSSWIAGSNPCGGTASDADTGNSKPWVGVLCYGGIVTGLRLGNLGLAGTIDVAALSHFRGLRSISFVNNSLSGPLPDIGRLDGLKSIYLSNNRFSGELPDSLFSPMDHLKKLWLDGNGFSGEIPSSLSNASSLMEIHLEKNSFSGVIPNITFPSLRSFNVSNNKLQGPIPSSLARFSASGAFEANSGLCGPPLAGPPCPPPAPQPVPATAAETTEATTSSPAEPSGNVKAGHVVLLAVGLLLLFLLLVIGFAVVKNHRRERFDAMGDHNDTGSVAEAMEAAAAAPPVQLPASASSGNGKRVGSGGSSGAELVMVNSEREPFGLQDLMKATAEVLGNGGLGSAYKAVMAGGFAVAVKRMRELTRLNRDGFDAEMRRLGRLRHPNVLTPLAYHFRKEEKLIVSDYVPKGSLLYVLHGDRGADHAALYWPTRLKIVRGIARGMAYLHAELSSVEAPHGNLKTSSVFLSPTFDPLLADFGLVPLVNPAAAPAALFAFTSPEALQYRHVSPKSDVYCFGVVVLELLTGKFPSQYLHNAKGGTDVVQWTASAIADRREAELVDPAIIGKAARPTPEMLRLLRVGAACTQAIPEERPEMKEAAELVEEICTAAAFAGPGSGDLGAAVDGSRVAGWESSSRPGSFDEAPTTVQLNGDLLSL